jgi:integrase
MPQHKLTDKSIRAIKASEREQNIGDGGGLWLRVQPIAKKGAISFYYRYAMDGKQRRFGCGSYPEVSLAQAREARDAARRQVEQGIDPSTAAQADKATRRAQALAAANERTVDGLFNDWKLIYLSAHHKDNGDALKAIHDHDISPIIGTRSARSIKLADVVSVIDPIVKRGARRKANRVLSVLRQMFRFGLARGVVDTDPTLGMSKKEAGGRERPRDRNLSFEELKELFAMLPSSGLTARIQAALKLILGTGVRVGELANARWNEVDREGLNWRIPAENSKNGKPHLVHLSKFSDAQLAFLQSEQSNEFVLAGRKEKTAIDEKSLSKAVRDRTRQKPLKKRTPKASALLLTGGAWTPHDLRRTAASRMGDLGVQPHVIEKVLNHTQPGIAGVYQRQEYLEERKAAFDLWGDRLIAIEQLASGALK